MNKEIYEKEPSLSFIDGVWLMHTIYRNAIENELGGNEFGAAYDAMDFKASEIHDIIINKLFVDGYLEERTNDLMKKFNIPEEYIVE